MCLLCSKSFYNLDVFRHHKKHINRNIFATSGGRGNTNSKILLNVHTHHIFFFYFISPHKICNTSLYIPLPSVLCKYNRFLFVNIYHYHHIVNIIIVSLYISSSFHYHCSSVNIIICSSVHLLSHHFFYILSSSVNFCSCCS